MKRVITLVIIVALAGFAFAADNDNITVNYQVDAINELNIDDASVSLTVNAATAGSEPTAATDASTYDITTNVDGPATKKITGAIDVNMDAGLTLSIDVTAPSTGTGAGATSMSTSAADVVTAIAAVAEADIAIDFSLAATVAAGTVGASSKTLTLTVTDS